MRAGHESRSLCARSFPISRLGTPVSPKLRFAVHGLQQGRPNFAGRPFRALWISNRRFADKCIPNLEIGNERAFCERHFERVSQRLSCFHRLTLTALSTALTASASAQMLMPQGRSMPAAAPTPEIRPIAPPVPVFPYPLWMVVVAVFLALLVLGAIAWAVVRHIRNRPQPPPPTPRELALAALQLLRERTSTAEPYPFSIEVSDVLRTFVTREFRVRATNQTSPEFLAAAARSPRFSEADKALCAAFLEKADLIKFARVHATTADSEQLLEQAFRFVEGGVPA